MKRAKTISALGLLVAGLFVWGQIDASKDPVKLALGGHSLTSSIAIALNTPNQSRPLDD